MTSNSESNICDHKDKHCKRCGYIEYSSLNPSASYYIMERISREPIKEMVCPDCNVLMQIHFQSNHRRYYRCLRCNFRDTDKTFYDSEQKNFIDLTKGV